MYVCMYVEGKYLRYVHTYITNRYNDQLFSTSECMYKHTVGVVGRVYPQRIHTYIHIYIHKYLSSRPPEVAFAAR